MLLKIIIAGLIVASTIFAAFFFNTKSIDSKHLKYRNYRRAVNAEGARKDDLAFYYAFMKNQQNAVWHYKRLFGVSSKCAARVVDEIELACLVKEHKDKKLKGNSL